MKTTWHEDMNFVHDKARNYPYYSVFWDKRIGPVPNGSFDFGQDMRCLLDHVISLSKTEADKDGWITKSASDWEKITGLTSYNFRYSCLLLAQDKLIQMRTELRNLTNSELKKPDWYNDTFRIKVEYSQVRVLIETYSKTVNEEKPPIVEDTSISGVVYLLKSDSHYKIGKSINIDNRLTQIKLLLPFEVELVHTIETNDVSWLERHWHRYFASKRANGEWFNLSDKDVAEFKATTKIEVNK